MPPLRDARDKRTRYEALRGALWTERASFDAHWRELGDFLLPRRTRFWSGDRNKGDKRNQNIIDSTARFSVRTLASGMHAGLTSPARPWFKLTTPDPDLAKQPQVKAWLHEVTKRMLTVFLQTNIYNVFPLVYGDMGCFGTGAMAMISDARDLFRCYSYPIGSYALGQDARGLTTTFVRDYQKTVRQIVEDYGVTADGRTIDWSTISRTTKDLWEHSDYETPVDLTWLVKPNDDADRSRPLAKYKPWASCTWETGDNQGVFLHESGFDSFPVLAPRWDITGEDSYGTDCPGMTALGDIKQLQIMQRRKGQAISKMVDPPLVGPSSLRTQKVSLVPGDITYQDAREGQQGLKSIHEVTLNIQHLREDVGEVQYRIQRAFYEDLFLMLARSDDRRGAQPPTAREVDERHEEKLLALGPVIERTDDELLGRVIDRAFLMMDDAGLIPMPPESIRGIRLKVEYLGIMAQAQKVIGVVALDRFLQSTVPLMEQFPEMRKKVDANAVVDEYGEVLGVNPNLIRSTKEAERLQAEEAAQVQSAQQAEQAVNVAKAAQLASQAPVTGDSVLNSVVQQAGQQLPGRPGIPPAAAA